MLGAGGQDGARTLRVEADANLEEERLDLAGRDRY